MENIEKNGVETPESAADTQIDYKAEYERLSSENEKYKRLKDQYSKESADWKHKYTETLDEAQKQKIANEERESYYKNLEREFNLGKLSNGLSKTISNNDVAKNIAGKMLDGDYDGVANAINEYFANHDEELGKQFTEKLLKSNPTPPPSNANNGETSVSKKEFDKMGYSERLALKEKDPESYKKLAK